jgi:hypothetical protein
MHGPKAALSSFTMIKKIILFSVTLTTLKCFADNSVQYAVNMQDGGLILKEESDSLLNVERTYRSRSLDRGYFGMGWCSEIESQILFQGRGVIRLVNCQSSRPSLFKVTDTAAAYVNSENSQDQIVIKLGYYERRIKNEWIAKYNFKGNLIEYRKNKKVIKLMYNARNLPEKVLIDGKIYSLGWHPILDLIEKVKLDSSTQVLTYAGFNLIKTQWENKIIQYTYDDLDNLTSRKTQHLSDNLLISYDKVADKVLKIEGLCHEYYSYKRTSPQRTLSTVSKSCQHQGSKKEFIFEYAKNAFKPSQIIVSESILNKVERLSLNQGGEL